MVDLKDGVVHAHTLDTVLELVEEHLARIVERFVVNTDGKYEMAEEKVRNLVSPCHLAPCLEGQLYVVGIKGGGVVGYVSKGHIGVKELHSLQLVAGKLLALSDEKLLAHGLDAFSKRCLHLSTILGFLNEMCGCPCAC